MRSRQGIRIAVVAALAVGVMSVPAVSQAHTKTFGSAVTAAAQNKNRVSGKVTSGKAKCLAQRKVGVYSASGALEATAVTDALGAFGVTDKDLSVGTHYVTVGKRLILKNRKHTHICGVAKTSFLVS